MERCMSRLNTSLRSSANRAAIKPIYETEHVVSEGGQNSPLALPWGKKKLLQSVTDTTNDIRLWGPIHRPAANSSELPPPAFN